MAFIILLNFQMLLSPTAFLLFMLTHICIIQIHNCNTKVTTSLKQNISETKVQWLYKLFHGIKLINTRISMPKLDMSRKDSRETGSQVTPMNLVIGVSRPPVLNRGTIFHPDYGSRDSFHSFRRSLKSYLFGD